MSAATVEVRVTLLGPCQRPGGARGREDPAVGRVHSAIILFFWRRKHSHLTNKTELQGAKRHRGACRGFSSHYTDAAVLTSEQLGE